MAANARLFKARLAFKLAAQARRQAQEATKSIRIRRSMMLSVLDFGVVAVEVPYYWAVYYHDGRGPVRAKRGKKIVYFKDPDDDPRINGAARNYPRRASNIRRLSKKQFERFLRQGKLIAVDSVGPADGDPFFTKGLRTFPQRIRSTAVAAFSQHVRQCLGKRMNLRLGAKLRI